MADNIYLPSDKGLVQLIDNAWKGFCAEAEKAGYNIGEDTAEGFVKDAFVGGYVYGYNDLLQLFQGQTEIGKMVKDAFGNEEEGK